MSSWRPYDRLCKTPLYINYDILLAKFKGITLIKIIINGSCLPFVWVRKIHNLFLGMGSTSCFLNTKEIMSFCNTKVWDIHPLSTRAPHCYILLVVMKWCKNEKSNSIWMIILNDIVCNLNVFGSRLWIPKESIALICHIPTQKSY